MEKLWPLTALTAEDGELWIGGCAASALAAEYGTPLYVFDEATLRGHVQRYRAALARHYPGSGQTAYASKAYLSLALARLLTEEGLDLDVVSGGELHLALAAGFPASRIHFHGNNKSRDELRQALAAGVGRIVVDNFHELDLLAELAGDRSSSPVPIWLRLSPGIQAHTHAHIQTGHVDTKFGFALATGDAERALAAAARSPHLSLVGLHAHIGSQIYEADRLAEAAARLVEFVAEMRTRYRCELAELSPGGGWGVPMTAGDPEAPIEVYVATMARAVVSACQAAGLPLPRLVLEPGRSLVAQTAVALYRVGARKEVPDVRTYVSVDGGMADNIRPALYEASYTARVIPGAPGAARPDQRESETVTIAGRFCESGDILIRDLLLPRLTPGDLLAIPMAGAYTLSMASNYNLVPRPAAVLVSGGAARIMQRRETYADLLARDVLPGGPAAARPLRFVKYQALGNDYLVIDPADLPEPPSADLVRAMCDRHLGVGADGVLWGPCGGAAFQLRLFNPDGGEFEKSGNGLRIFARYLWDRGLPPGPDFTIGTPVGPVVAHVLDPGGSRIAMDMGQLSFDSRAIPVLGPAREVIEETVQVEGQPFRITAVSIGNPHCVLFVDEPTSTLARALGPQLERCPLFPHRSNVQFARARDRHTLQIEIWERGAGYTLASGTSSCAAAGAAVRTGRCASPVTVRMPGGEMLVEIAADWSVRLTGTVGPVCRGEFAVSGGAL